jgi:hypothetical protein
MYQQKKSWIFLSPRSASFSSPSRSSLPLPRRRLFVGNKINVDIYLLNPSVLVRARPHRVEAHLHREGGLPSHRDGHQPVHHGAAGVLDGHRAAAGLHHGPAPVPGLPAEEGAWQAGLRHARPGQRAGARDHDHRGGLPHQSRCTVMGEARVKQHACVAAVLPPSQAVPEEAETERQNGAVGGASVLRKRRGGGVAWWRSSVALRRPMGRRR